MVSRRENRRAAFHRNAIFIETLWGLGEIGKRVDRLAGSPHPVRDGRVERHQIGIDLVGELDHRGLDHPLGKLTDVQRQLFRGEPEIDALLLVHDKSGLAFHNVLIGRGGTIADGEVGRALDRNGIARLVAVHRVAELGFVGAVNELRHNEVIFEDHQRLFGDDVDRQSRICHVEYPSKGGAALPSARPLFR